MRSRPALARSAFRSARRRGCRATFSCWSRATSNGSPATRTAITVGVVTVAGKREQGRYALDERDRPPALLQRLFRGEISAAQARPDRRPGRRSAARWRTGAASVFNERILLFDPRRQPDATAQRHLQRRRARDGAPVVRRPGHDGLVGRPLAERGLRQLDADQGGRPAPSGLAGLAQQRAVRSRPRWTWTRAARRTDPAAGRRRERGGGDFDSITYSKGQAFLRMLETYLGADDVPRGHPELHARPRLQQRDHGRLWARACRAPRARRSRPSPAPYTEQPGVPLVVSRGELRDGRAAARMRQERFYSTDPKAARNTGRYRSPTGAGAKEPSGVVLMRQRHDRHRGRAMRRADQTQLRRRGLLSTCTMTWRRRPRSPSRPKRWGRRTGSACSRTTGPCSRPAASGRRYIFDVGRRVADDRQPRRLGSR